MGRRLFNQLVRVIEGCKMGDEEKLTSESTNSETQEIGLPQPTRRNLIKGFALFGVAGAAGFLTACSSGSSSDSSESPAATSSDSVATSGSDGSGNSQQNQDDGSDVELLLTTDAWTEGEEIPIQFTCDGDDVPPRLFWTAIPEETLELALIVEDDDANGFVHWVVYGVNPTDREFSQGADIKYPEGRNDFGRDGYGGPCPPAGETHSYRFTFLALSETTDLESGATADELRAKAEGAVIETAELTGIYTRPDDA